MYNNFCYQYFITAILRSVCFFICVAHLSLLSMHDDRDIVTVSGCCFLSDRFKEICTDASKKENIRRVRMVSHNAAGIEEEEDIPLSTVLSCIELSKIPNGSDEEWDLFLKRDINSKIFLHDMHEIARIAYDYDRSDEDHTLEQRAIDGYILQYTRNGGCPERFKLQDPRSVIAYAEYDGGHSDHDRIIIATGMGGLFRTMNGYGSQLVPLVYPKQLSKIKDYEIFKEWRCKEKRYAKFYPTDSTDFQDTLARIVSDFQYTMVAINDTKSAAAKKGMIEIFEKQNLIRMINLEKNQTVPCMFLPSTTDSFAYVSIGKCGALKPPSEFIRKNLHWITDIHSCDGPERTFTFETYRNRQQYEFEEDDNNFLHLNAWDGLRHTEVTVDKLGKPTETHQDLISHIMRKANVNPHWQYALTLFKSKVDEASTTMMKRYQNQDSSLTEVRKRIHWDEICKDQLSPEELKKLLVVGYILGVMSQKIKVPWYTAEHDAKIKEYFMKRVALPHDQQGTLGIIAYPDGTIYKNKGAIIFSPDADKSRQFSIPNHALLGAAMNSSLDAIDVALHVRSKEINLLVDHDTVAFVDPQNDGHTIVRKYISKPNGEYEERGTFTQREPEPGTRRSVATVGKDYKQWKMDLIEEVYADPVSSAVLPKLMAQNMVWKGMLLPIRSKKNSDGSVCITDQVKPKLYYDWWNRPYGIYKKVFPLDYICPRICSATSTSNNPQEAAKYDVVPGRKYVSWNLLSIPSWYGCIKSLLRTLF
jgi:hypothetical protein